MCNYIRDLEDLALESDPLGTSNVGDSTVKSIQFKSKSFFYLGNFRTPDMAKFQKAIKQDLKDQPYERAKLLSSIIQIKGTSLWS